MADAGRVIAGAARGRRLLAPGEGTRPLADRVKQTLFAILEPDLPGSSFLDLFAGSGAAGIEALSRGAASAVFVEKDAAACRTIEANLAATGLGGPTIRVVRSAVASYLRGRAAADGLFTIVFVDPPYGETNLLGEVLELLGAADNARDNAPHNAAAALVVVGGRVVAKHFWRDVPRSHIGLLASERERRFGETALTFYRRVAEADGEPAVVEG